MRRAFALATLVACAPSRDAALPEALTAQTHLLATLDEAGAIARLEVFDAARLPVTMLEVDELSLLLLAFDQPLSALAAPPSEDGAIATFAIDADPDETWELTSPSAAWELASGSAELRRTDASARLAALRVARPPCPRMMPRTISGLPPRSVRFAVRWGDEIWTGSDTQMALTQQVFRIDLATETAAVIPMPEPQNNDRIPLAFLAEPNLWVLWQTDPAHDSFVVLDREGLIVDTVTPTTSGLQLDGLAGAHFDGVPTVIARGQQPVDFFALDEQTRGWVRVASSPSDCDVNARAQILEITGPRQALIGVDGGQIVAFDVDRPWVFGAPLIPGQGDTCRSARTTLASGVQMVAYQQSLPDETLTRRDFLKWRLPGGEWRQVNRTSVVSGKSIGAVGDLVLVGGDNDVILLYEYTPARPNVPPRFCGKLGAAINVLHVLAVDEDTAFIGGLSGPAALFIDLVR